MKAGLKGASRGIEKGLKGASRGLENGFKGVSRGLQGGFKGASRGLEKGFKGAWEGLQGGFKGASSPSYLRASYPGGGTLQAPLEGYLRRWWLGSTPPPSPLPLSSSFWPLFFLFSFLFVWLLFVCSFPPLFLVCLVWPLLFSWAIALSFPVWPSLPRGLLWCCLAVQWSLPAGVSPNVWLKVAFLHLAFCFDMLFIF